MHLLFINIHILRLFCLAFPKVYANVTSTNHNTLKLKGKVMNAEALRNNLPDLHVWGTELSRKDFERLFTRTDEKITFTLNGWDGKSYEGESRRASVYRTDIGGFEWVRLVKVGKGLHYIDEDSVIMEKATGESHLEAEWLINIARA